MTPKSKGRDFKKKSRAQKFNPNVKREQPRKDSSSKRINLDNERISRLEKDIVTESGSWGKTSARNAINWYNRNPQALAGAANISTVFPTGSVYPWLNLDKNGVACMPAVMSIGLATTLGTSADVPLNQASQGNYSFVVHANSRNKLYDAPDLTINYLASANIFAALAKGIRAYGSMLMFTAENLQMPEALIRAQGFNYQDLLNNYYRMRNDLNIRIARARDVWVPKDIPLIERWFWLNTNIYMDSQSVKDQFYVLNVTTFYKFSEISSTSGGELVLTDKVSVTDWEGGDVTWSKYLSMVDDMLDVFMGSQDRGIMSGDVLKAYGGENLYRLDEVPEGYTVIPTYDPEVLTQIMNATYVPNLVMSRITQNNSGTTPVLETKFSLRSIAIPSYPYTYPAIALPPPYACLNFKMSAPPTQDQIVEATRLTSIGSRRILADGKTDQYLYVPKTSGTEFMRSATVWYTRWDGTEKKLKISSETKTANDNAIRRILFPFDWRPLDYALVYKEAGDDTTATKVVKPYYIEDITGEMEWIVPLDNGTLDRLNVVCLYSLLGVPGNLN